MTLQITRTDHAQVYGSPKSAVDSGPIFRGQRWTRSKGSRRRLNSGCTTGHSTRARWLAQSDEVHRNVDRFALVKLVHLRHVKLHLCQHLCLSAPRCSCSENVLQCHSQSHNRHDKRLQATKPKHDPCSHPNHTLSNMQPATSPHAAITRRMTGLTSRVDVLCNEYTDVVATSYAVLRNTMSALVTRVPKGGFIITVSIIGNPATNTHTYKTEVQQYDIRTHCDNTWCARQ